MRCQEHPLQSEHLVFSPSERILTDACYLEKEYDKNRLEGLVFCAYELNYLYKASTTEMIEMFELHDQVFILNNDQIYKLYLTKESMHKFFSS